MTAFLFIHLLTKKVMPEADQPLAEKKVAKKERNNYYCYQVSSLTLYELIYQHHFLLIFSVTFYFEATSDTKSGISTS